MSDQRPTSIWQRLQERPALLVGVAAGIVALVVIIVVVLAGGGGESEDTVSGDTSGSATPTATASVTATPTPTPSGPLPEVTDVAPDLDFFGELAAVHSQPVTATFNSAVDSLSLADGAAIEVPAGAFPAPTELSVAIIDLLFENYLVNPPEARIYVLSTEDDIVLGAPLVLEVPKPADSVNVRRFVDGEWLPVDVQAGPTTLIEITHFSDNTIEVGDKTPGDLELLPGVGETSGAVAADLLAGCIVYMGGLFDEDPNRLKFEFFFGVCTKALVNLLTPEGEKVEVACVGDEIGDGVNIQQAIDKCLADQKTDPSPSQSVAPQPEPEPEPEPQPEPEPEPPEPEVTDALIPRPADSSFTFSSCTERADLDPDLLECIVTFNVSMDYTASELPRSIGCFAEYQGDFVFNGFASDPVALSALEGVAIVSPWGFALFDESSNPIFSNPLTVECTLSAFSFLPGGIPLDTVKLTFVVTSSGIEIEDCFPPAHPDCGPP